MARLLSFIVTIARLALLTAFSVMIFAVIVQVVSRTFLPQSPVWTEELTRFALLYLTAIGAGLSLRSGDLVSVDLVVTALPERARRWARLGASLATLALAAVMFGPSLDFARIGALQTSPALGWTMSAIHVTTTIAAASLFVFALAQALSLLSGRGAGGQEE